MAAYLSADRFIRRQEVRPLKAIKLTWLADTGQARKRRLGAGSIVLLGSVVETRWVSPGDRAEIRIDKLGGTGATFD